MKLWIHRGRHVRHVPGLELWAGNGEGNLAMKHCKSCSKHWISSRHKVCRSLMLMMMMMMMMMMTTLTNEKEKLTGTKVGNLPIYQHNWGITLVTGTANAQAPVQRRRIGRTEIWRCGDPREEPTAPDLRCGPFHIFSLLTVGGFNPSEKY